MHRLGIAFVLSLASMVGVAIAAEPGEKTETRAVAPPMKPGRDGWYDASPPDGSFKVRSPGVFRGFVEDGTSDAGAVTHTVGVRAKFSAAFGSETSYTASCIQQKGDQRSGSERLRTMIERWDGLGAMRYRKHVDSAPLLGFEFEMGGRLQGLSRTPPRAREGHLHAVAQLAPSRQAERCRHREILRLVRARQALNCARSAGSACDPAAVTFARPRATHG